MLCSTYAASNSSQSKLRGNPSYDGSQLKFFSNVTSSNWTVGYQRQRARLLGCGSCLNNNNKIYMGSSAEPLLLSFVAVLFPSLLWRFFNNRLLLYSESSASRASQRGHRARPHLLTSVRKLGRVVPVLKVGTYLEGVMVMLRIILLLRSESQSQLVNIIDSVMEVHAVNASAKELTPTAPVSDDTAVAGVLGQDSGSPDSNAESISDANMDLSSTNSAIPASLVSPHPSPEFQSYDREREARAARVLVVDVVSIHSNILSSSFAEISNREARRNSRRMFWDALSRSNLRRNRDSPTIVIATSHADDLGSHDRWLLDFRGDLHFNGDGLESRYPGVRSHNRSGRRWQSRVILYTFPSYRERFHDVRDEQGWETSLCPAGLHPNDTCSCEPSSVADVSSSRASISQITLLADALFEVLEAIHHHRLSLSPSMLSLPAPEAVVHSFPLKNYKKLQGNENGAQYEQQIAFDASRLIFTSLISEFVNPSVLLIGTSFRRTIGLTRADYKLSSHCLVVLLLAFSVCPLCRDNVCKGNAESSAPNPEITAL
ncbi:hypothetical protein SADUNF_Sadunf02G0118300 [Salix dunnii]|uniref:Uncharacterized protein n=1 Tax=Salix dunnii TaxID=1413687 RepID=A0A835N7I2_9ROSI|nr:hypothetical protein SADUNF_Sadunf02G0118300 [Salix dunnii]